VARFAERVVFRRLGVFVGGWSLEAAESVCSGGTVERHDVLVCLTRLVDASLVQVEDRDGRARYRLLEPVRQYAQGRLRGSGELDALRRHHAAFFLSFALQWETDANFGGPGRRAGLTALEGELDNLRALLQWCLEQGEAQKGIFLARALWTFWVMRGLYTEGRSWLRRLAALPDAANAPAMRAVAQGIEASLAWRQGNYTEAQALFREVLPHLRRAHADQALAAARAAGHRVDEAIVLHVLGWLALMQADYSTARALGEVSQALARAGGDEDALCLALTTLAQVVLRQGDLSAARRFVDEGLALARRIGEYWWLSDSLDVLAQLAIADRHYGHARSATRESLLLRQNLGSRSAIAYSLENIAALAAAEKEPQCALQLAGAAASIREAIGEQQSLMSQAMADQWLIPLQQALSQDAFRSAWEAGRAMSLEQALELALAATQTPATQSDQPPAGSGPRVTQLSPREQQVAALLAQGLTNR
jgi:non-specific serine/threonine protein kinase